MESSLGSLDAQTGMVGKCGVRREAVHTMERISRPRSPRAGLWYDWRIAVQPKL